MRAALRQSSLKAYLYCPRSYQLRFLEDVPPGHRSPAAMNGSTVHELLRRFHAGEWEMDLDQGYQEVFSELEDGEEGEIPIRWKDETAERAKFQEEAVSMLKGYREKDYNREAEVILAEAPFTLTVGKQTFTGTVDQLRRNPDGSIELVDFKTSRFSVSQAFLDVDYQMGLYAAALRSGVFQVDGKPRMPAILPNRITWYHLRHHIPYKRKTRGADVGDERGDPRLTTRRTERDLEELIRDVGMIAEAIQRGLFPKNPSQNTCGFCPYAGQCGLGGLEMPHKHEFGKEDYE